MWENGGHVGEWWACGRMVGKWGDEGGGGGGGGGERHILVYVFYGGGHPCSLVNLTINLNSLHVDRFLRTTYDEKDGTDFNRRATDCENRGGRAHAP
jgi:hypothetical protein